MSLSGSYIVICKFEGSKWTRNGVPSITDRIILFFPIPFLTPLKISYMKENSGSFKEHDFNSDPGDLLRVFIDLSCRLKRKIHVLKIPCKINEQLIKWKRQNTFRDRSNALYNMLEISEKLKNFRLIILWTLSSQFKFL